MSPLSTERRHPTRLHPLARYAVSLAALAAAIVLRMLLDPYLGDALPLVTLFGAVAVAVWIGGWKAAALITILGYLIADWYFIQPRTGFALFDRSDAVIGFLAYCFTCAMIVGLGEAMRTARRRADDRREMLMVTLRSIGDGVITTDTAASVTYINDVAAALTGSTLDEVLGHELESVFRIVNETTRKPVENPVLQSLRQGVVAGLANHTMLLRSDGTEIPIDDSAAPIRDTLGRVTGCVLIFRDVTAQRAAERDRATRLAEARLLAAIVESSDDAIISKSLASIIQSWNAAAERMFGYSAAEAVGRHVSLVIPPERVDEENAIIAELRQGRRTEHLETERLTRDGRRLPVSLTISPVRNDDGEIVGASTIIRDITERRRMDDSLRKLAADLSEADRRKNEFLATLAHELRNPLAPLSNMLEVMKRTENDSDTVRRARDTMERQLSQLVRLVDDLLDVNRITHDRLELRLAEVELSAIVRQAIEATKPLVDAERHVLVVDLPKEPVWLRCDPARLAQVVGNLLHNSAKYTPPGGRIVVTGRTEGDEAVISVRDDGVGIPADELDSIFDMFTQVDRSNVRGQGGLGIGLALVKRLIQMHGGSVSVMSAGVGQGSEFVVRLPVIAAPAETKAPAHGTAATPSAPVRRILVADDNHDSAESIAMLLQIEGHETIVAHDGIEALDLAERHRPDALLLDIGMPGMDGHEVCRAVRARPWGRDVRVIALTGWGQEEDYRRSGEAGFDGHLVKPADYVALVRLLGPDGMDEQRRAV